MLLQNSLSSHYFIHLLAHINNRITNYIHLLSLLKDAYIMGTRKQKMMISKDNVEAIYSMEPPGRFLKKCADTGQWKELSEREATNKAAQAMAYLVIVQEKKKPKTKHSHSHHSSSSSNASFAVPAQLTDCQPIQQFQDDHHSASIVLASISSSSGVRRQWGEVTNNNAGDGGGHNSSNIPREDELLPYKFSLHHQLREMQQSSTTLSGDATPQPKAKARHQQRQRQLHHDHQMGRHEQNELLPHTRLPPSSLPPTQSSIAPAHRAGMLRNLISTAVGGVSYAC